MAFSSTTFGSSAPAPGAPPAPAFSLGGTTAATSAPPASSGGLFGAPAPSASTGGFGGFGGFGSTSSAAPAPAFGAAPAPAFAATPAALFGATPTSAPSLFGAPPTATPAPAFGASPAPAFGATSATTPGFGTAPATATEITGKTMYADLPAEGKRLIDALHSEMMRHKRTMTMVETMSPALLREHSPSAPGDAAAGDATLSSPHVTPLPAQLSAFQNQLQSLKHKLEQSRLQGLELYRQYETSTTQAIQYGTWPLEAVAMRRGVKLSKVTPVASSSSAGDKTAQSQVKVQIQRSLDQQVAHVDRIETIPSPYIWQTLRDLMRRAEELGNQVSALEADMKVVMRTAHHPHQDEIDVTSIVQAHAEHIMRMAYSVANLHGHMDSLRALYQRSVQSSGRPDVLQRARVAEAKRLQNLDLAAKAQVLKASTAPMPSGSSSSTNAAPPSAFGAAPAPSGGLFGGAPAPAPTTGGLFGATTPAPAAGSIFGGSAPAPSGGLFGSTTAPSPALSGGLFGSTTAPSPAPSGGLFGATPAPAPTGGAFGATTASTTGGLFGSTAPAPAGHGTFASAPAGATTAPGGFSFGNTSSTASTPKSKSRSRR